MFPAPPPWEGMHPIVVHFPIALLLIAPLFLLFAAFRPKATPTALAALSLLILGTGFLFLAVATGEAAEDQAEAVSAAKATLQRHEELAEIARPVFLGFTVLYAGVVAASLILKDKLKRPVWAGLHLGFLLLYAGGALLLANIAHDGGRLVHEFGVHAPLAGTVGQPPPVGAESHEDD